MTHARHRQASILGVLPFCICSAQLRAQFVTQSPNARIEFASNQMPNEFLTQDFSILCWVFPQQGVETVASIVQYPGVVSILAFEDRVVGLLEFGQTQSQLVAQVHRPLPLNQWSLVALSVSRASGTMQLSVRTDPISRTGNVPSRQTSLTSAPVQLGPLSSAPLGPATDTFHIGASNAIPSLQGMIGLVVLRDHPITTCDMDALWDSHDFLSPFMLTTQSSCGNMNGRAGCRWMVGHAMTAQPSDGGVGGSASQRAAIAGKQVSTYNVHVFDRNKLTNLHWHFDLRVVRPVESTQAIKYGLHSEQPYSGFFVRPVPAGGPISTFAGMSYAHRARELVEGPSGPVRVMTSANSRGVRYADDAGEVAPNYQHGLIAQLRSQCSGVLFRPVPHWGTGVSHSWFGFDFRSSPPRFSGTVHSIATGSAYNVAWKDFSYLGTGSSTADSNGPGLGVWMKDNGSYGIRCRPEDGSLMIAGAPLVVEAHYLAFPSASGMTITADRGSTQTAAGVVVAGPVVIESDTTSFAHTFVSEDTVIDASTMLLHGNFAAELNKGDLLVITSGPATSANSVIENVLSFSNATLVSLRHPLERVPTIGDGFSTGPFEVRTYSHTFDPVAEGDQNTWRGFLFTAVPGGTGAVLLAMSAYRPDANGFVIGSAGWSGNGYQRQMDLSSREAMVSWIKATKADIWIQSTADQYSQPQTMLEFTHIIREALPECDIVWAGEMAHAGGVTGYQIPWHTYIINNSPQAGVVGLSSLSDPRLGTFEQQVADGMRSDTAHISARGNAIQAAVWLDMLDEYIHTAPCPVADFDHNGTKNIFDYIAMASAYAAGDPAADIDRNGTLNVFDYIAFGNAYINCQ